MYSFKKFIEIKEAYQVDIEYDYVTELDDIINAAKIFTIKNPRKMKEFLEKESKNNEELKNLYQFKFLDKNKQFNDIKKTNTPLGYFSGYDFLQKIDSPI
jgi:hypothetical protein